MTGNGPAAKALLFTHHLKANPMEAIRTHSGAVPEGRTPTKMHPLLSVCIPTRNRALLLRKSLESVVREFRGEPVEVVVSDNASEDHTEGVVRSFSTVRYSRNAVNVGLDRNAQLCLQQATGTYAFLFSDDDVLIPGAGAAILGALRVWNPSFVYLHHAGFQEQDGPAAIIKGSALLNQPNVSYDAGFQLLLQRQLEHNSAMIFRVDELVPHFDALTEYHDASFERGFAPPVLAHRLVLTATGPFVFVGKCCVAVRNEAHPGYNPLYTSHIDIVRHYQKLKRAGLVTHAEFKALMNRRIWRVRDNLILWSKCSNDPRFTWREVKLFWQLDWRYWQFYFYVVPVLVTPRWVLRVVHRLARPLLRRHDRIANRPVRVAQSATR